MKIHKKGFTLVELIVVITILAILGSIAFIAMQGYTKSARDSQRIADIGQFRSGIEIFQVEAGVYPMPDNVDNSILVQSNPVNYPGTTGELSSSIARISDSISDPATLEEYSYAIEGNKKSYQIVYNLEDDGNAGILNEAHAADFVETVVVGNYNGVFAKTETGAMLTMPSLFAKHSTTGDVDYTAPTALDFTIPGQTTPVSYTPVAITSYTDTEDLITQIQSGYDNTVDESIISLEKVSEVKVLVASDTSSQESFESGYLGQTTTNSGGGSTPPETPTCTGNLVLENATVTNDTGLSSSTPYQNTDNTASCYFECTGSYTGMDCGGTDYAVILESGATTTHQYVRDVAFDSEGNMFVTGYYAGTSSVTFGNATLPNTRGGYDVFVAKIDTDGNVLGVKSFGGSNSDFGYEIAIDGNNNVYLTGYYHSAGSSIDLGTSVSTTSKNYEIFVIKLDSGLNYINHKVFGGSAGDYGRAIAIDGNNNIYLTGYYDSSGSSIDLGTSVSTTSKGHEIFVINLDSGLNYISHKVFGGSGYDYLYGVAIDGNNNIYLTGHYNSNGSSIDLGTSVSTTSKNAEIFVIKLDSSLNYINHKVFGGSEDDYGYGIAIDGNNNVYLTGYYYSNGSSIDLGISVSTTSKSHEVYVIKLDSSLNYINHKVFGGSSSDVGYSIAIDGNNNVYLTGYYYSNGGSIDLGTSVSTTSKSDEIFVIKLDSSLNYISHKVFGGSSQDYGECIAVDGAGNIGIGGYYYSNGFDMNGKTMTNNNTGYYNGFATKFYMQ